MKVATLYIFNNGVLIEYSELDKPLSSVWMTDSARVTTHIFDLVQRGWNIKSVNHIKEKCL